MKKFYHLLLLSLIAIFSIGCCCTKDTIRITQLENEVITYKNSQSEFEEKITELENKNDLCESKKNEFEEKIKTLENEIESIPSPEILFGNKYVKLYVLHTTLEGYNKVLLGVYNKSDNRIPAFLAEFDGCDTLEYYQEIYAQLAIENNNLKITSYQTNLPELSSIHSAPTFNIESFNSLITHTVELFHDLHLNTIGAHKRGHVMKSNGNDGIYNLYDIQYPIIDTNGISRDTIQEFKILTTLTVSTINTINFEVIDAVEKIIIEVERDHHPHPNN